MPRPTRQRCCGRSRGCDDAVWTSHGHSGRCGSSPDCLITVLACLFGYTTFADGIAGVAELGVFLTHTELSNATGPAVGSGAVAIGTSFAL